MKTKKFPAKLMIVGEYLALHSECSILTTPFPQFELSLKKGGGELIDFFIFLKKLTSLTPVINIERLKQLCSEGVFIDSNIPIGKGLGSSGAIVAATFDLLKKEKKLSPETLKTIFAQMESYFHHKSSGCDPLTSYLNISLLFENNRITKKPLIDIDLFYLHDSNTNRKANDLIKSSPLSVEVIKKINSINKSIIDKIISKKDISLDFSKLVQLQKEYFPHLFIKNTINKNLKLCGAGGGGYYIGLIK